MAHHLRLLLAAGLILITGMIPGGPAVAGGTGAWVDGPHTKARLIAANRTSGGQAEIAIQIKLEKGWKTYWRNPGDAGVPTLLDWTRSDNVKSAAAAWPVPQRLADPYGVSIGYKGDVVIPVRLAVSEPDKPVKVKLNLDYGVCAEVCIPVTSSLELDLEPGAGDHGHDALIAAWKARTPEGSATGDELELETVKRLEDGKTGMLVSVTGKGGLKSPDLFVEGPQAFYFSVPKLVSKTPERAIFRIEIDGAKSLADLKGHSMRLTMIDEGRAREIDWQLGKL